MTVKKEHASVVLVFGGFAVLVLVFRGVWGNAWHALIGGGAGSGSGAPGSAGVPGGTPAGFQLLPGSFNLQYPTPAGGALPGDSPFPAVIPRDMQNTPGGWTLDDFLRGNTQFEAAGYSPSDVVRASSAYAVSHKYTNPHNVAQEGHVETRNGVPGVWVKYNTPAGSSTEWTPLGTPGGSRPAPRKPSVVPSSWWR